MLKLVPCSQPRDVHLLTKFNSLFNSCSFDYYKTQIQTERQSQSLNHQITQIIILNGKLLRLFDMSVQHYKCNG